MATGKDQRQRAIIDLIRSGPIRSQRQLRTALKRHGIDATQATVSRDVRELRIVKVTGADGQPSYTLPDEWETSAPLQRLLPTLFLSAEGAGNLIVVRTMTGAAQAVARGIDWEEWAEILGTIAGDDTILLVLRDARHRAAVLRRLRALAEP